MSFTAIYSENMDIPVAKQDPDSNELTMTAVTKENETNSPPPTKPQPQPQPFASMLAKPQPLTSPSRNRSNPARSRKPNPPSKDPGLGPIPTTYEEASNEDKLPIRLKDENKPWAETTKTLEDITGMTLGAELRVKANLVGYEEGDGPILFDFKKDIEDRQELEKWQRTVKGIEARSGNKYPISALQKKFKESTKVGDVAFAVKDGE